MALMTHAFIETVTLPTAAHYRSLGNPVQTNFDHALDHADNAVNDDAYVAAMVEAAHIAGIAVPASNSIALCDCWSAAGGCGCDLIFDAALPGVRVTETATGGNRDRLLCPDCAHDHPRTNT